MGVSRQFCFLFVAIAKGIPCSFLSLTALHFVNFLFREVMVLKCPKVYFYKDLDLLLPVADNLPLFCCYLSIKKIIFIKQGFV